MKKVRTFQHFTHVESFLKIVQKEHLIEQVAKELNWSANFSEQKNEFNYLYLRNFRYNCRVTILVEENYFYINVQDYYQFAPYDCGFNKKTAKKIKSKILELQNSASP